MNIPERIMQTMQLSGRPLTAAEIAERGNIGRHPNTITNHLELMKTAKAASSALVEGKVVWSLSEKKKTAPPPLVCVDCGGPRSYSSGQRCRECYSTSCTPEQEEKIRLFIAEGIVDAGALSDVTGIKLKTIKAFLRDNPVSRESSAQPKPNTAATCNNKEEKQSMASKSRKESAPEGNASDAIPPAVMELRRLQDLYCQPVLENTEEKIAWLKAAADFARTAGAEHSADLATEIANDLEAIASA